ncbi:MAG TPA: universal stress protein [Acidimicrobiales bacterium]|nr:universal stress protein [Acidimicrobiales bacterium]
MFENVVVGADSSPTAAQAVIYAIDLAKLSGGTLHIVTAFQRGGGMTVDLPGESRQSVGSIDLAESLVEDLGSRARAAGVTVQTHAASGEPAERIIEVAKKVGADVVVVGNKGLQRRVLGSVPASVARGAPCAVLIVRTT